MIKNILNLTKVFIGNFYENVEFFRKKDKKSRFTWYVVILVLAIIYLSFEIITFLKSIGIQDIFLDGIFLIVSVLNIFQTIMICTNIFYFSKDSEYVIPLPFTTTELLVAKFNTMLSVLYVSELIMGFIPLFLFALITHQGIMFYIYVILFLLLNPICIATIVGILMLLVMRVFKFVKNKDAFQTGIVLLLMVTLVGTEYFAMKKAFSTDVANEQGTIQITNLSEKMQEINKYIIVANPAVNALKNSNKLSSALEILKILFYDIFALGIFLFIGNKIYLEDFLKNISYMNIKKHRKISIKKKSKLRGAKKAYIIKEFSELVKNPAFFIQCIYPMLMTMIIFTIVVLSFTPMIQEQFRSERFIREFGEIKADLTYVSTILIVIQIIISLSNISITAISREGKNAKVMKYIPISFYSQYVCKNIPQVLFNIPICILVIALIENIFGFLTILSIIELFILSMLLNVINSYLMVIVDSMRPNLMWDAEYMVIKQNKNKLFQYILLIGMVLIIIYIQKVLKDMNLNFAMFIMIIIFTIALILIDRYVYKKQDKIFDKIN